MLFPCYFIHSFIMHRYKHLSVCLSVYPSIHPSLWYIVIKGFFWEITFNVKTTTNNIIKYVCTYHRIKYTSFSFKAFSNLVNVQRHLKVGKEVIQSLQGQKKGLNILENDDSRIGKLMKKPCLCVGWKCSLFNDTHTPNQISSSLECLETIIRSHSGTWKVAVDAAGCCCSQPRADMRQ